MRIQIDTEVRPYDSAYGEVSNVIARTTDREECLYPGESIVKDLPVAVGNTVYAVVADYTDQGGTFGSPAGCASVLDVFLTEQEAADLAIAAKADPVPDDEGYYDRFHFTHNGREYHKAWEDYFARLNSLDVWDAIVRDGGGRLPENVRPVGYTRKTGH